MSSVQFVKISWKVCQVTQSRFHYPAQKRSRSEKSKWFTLVDSGLIALATVINYIDRSALAIMWPSIEGDVGLGKDDYAFIGIMFTIAYAISQSLSGKLVR